MKGEESRGVALPAVDRSFDSEFKHLPKGERQPHENCAQEELHGRQLELGGSHRNHNEKVENGRASSTILEERQRSIVAKRNKKHEKTPEGG